MTMVLVFDLDDTLYDELSYVQSGFRVVAHFLEEREGMPRDESYAFMCESLKSGRGTIFDQTLRKYGAWSKRKVQACVWAYRTHFPTIQLYPEASVCLERFTSHPVYIVTDGNKVAQYNKVVALGLYSYVKQVFLTHRYGLKNAKPSPYCFLKIARKEKAPPEQVVHIGDNPHKDFVGLKPLGFRTIRVLTGQYRHLKPDEAYDAHTTIDSLDELTPESLKTLFPLPE